MPEAYSRPFSVVNEASILRRDASLNFHPHSIFKIDCDINFLLVANRPLSAAQQPNANRCPQWENAAHAPALPAALEIPRTVQNRNPKSSAGPGV